MRWWLARMREKSTWLAIFTLASLVGVQIEPELRDRLLEAILAAAAVVAFIFKEAPDEPQLPFRSADKPDQQYDIPADDRVDRAHQVFDSGSAYRQSLRVPQSAMPSTNEPESYHQSNGATDGFNDR